MGIVPTGGVKRKDPLADLSVRKLELKEQIVAKQHHISNSTQKLMTPVSIIGSILSVFGRKIDIVNGVSVGFNLISKIRDFFKK